jgi:hypothetical protein
MSKREVLLDLECAKYGEGIIRKISEQMKERVDKNKIESLITKMLGVLQEDGLYAFALYAKSKSPNSAEEKKSQEAITADVVYKETKALLKDKKIKLLNNKTELLEAIRESLGDDLEKLFFAKELVERMLVYARYHAKALPGEIESSEVEGQ